jgi:hypothetical protein
VHPIEEGLAKLAALGTADQIRLQFAAEQIEALWGSAHTCPVALWLKKHDYIPEGYVAAVIPIPMLGAYNPADAGHVAIREKNTGPGYRLPEGDRQEFEMPQEVQWFALRFDNHCYPELERGKAW